MRTKETVQFDFGANWKVFSRRALNVERVRQAEEDFSSLLAGIELRDRSFLDIGFGQGLTLLIAASRGAQTIGCDINSTCADVLREVRDCYFPNVAAETVPIVIGSILDDLVIESLRVRSPRSGRGYDIVHSWGVLHHTGDMRRAIRNAASLVAPEGHLIIAIYARHWSSKAWRAIKRFYNGGPTFIRRLILAIMIPVIYIAKWCVTRRNPLKQQRGMSYYCDTIDWLGGYPYEYATHAEVRRMLEDLGFERVRFIPAIVPTGCNEFVFKRLPVL